MGPRSGAFTSGPDSGADAAVDEDVDAREEAGFVGRQECDRRPTNLASGLGRHFCLGAFLARGELEITLETLRAFQTCVCWRSLGSSAWC
jgi:hypothetical protein